jgi:hypothetical protein
MSKKNKYKFRQRPNVVANNSGEVVTNVNVPSSSATVVSPAPVSGMRGATAGAMAVHTAEYKIISRDLIRLIVLNGIMLAAVLVVYFTNKNNGYLERIFHNLVR